MKPIQFTLRILTLSCSLLQAKDTLPPLQPGNLPQSISALYAPFDPDREPLEVHIIKEWQEGGVTVRMLTYTVGTFKGVKSTLGAYYAFPSHWTAKLPAILYMHGGGQRATKESVIPAARNGYAAISINWGGNKMDDQQPSGPGTDWGALDATQKHNDHYASCQPDSKTLDAFDSPRNNNWYLIVLAAKRAVSFLQQQECVDPARICATGHSMGGTLTVMLAGCDKRIKAAVPSCGGVGTAPERLYARPGNAARPRNNNQIYLSLIDEVNYLKAITCPILYCGPQNDFNGLLDEMFMNWEPIPSKQVAFAVSPHLNHRHELAASFDDYLWFEQYLKGTLQLPKTPSLQVELQGPNGLPVATLKPDAPEKIDHAVIFYSVDPNGQFRFWRTAQATCSGHLWTAELPLLSKEMPLFCIANVYYKFPALKMEGPPWLKNPGNTFLLSSRLVGFEAAQVKQTGVKVSDCADRLIERDFANLQDWYELEKGNSHWRHLGTRKIKDPKWRGPLGAELAVDVHDPRGGEMVFTFSFNDYSQYGRDKCSGTFYALVPYAQADGWQTVQIKLAALKPMRPDQAGRPTDWQTLCELGLSGRERVSIDGKQVELGSGLFDEKRQLRNLRWEGGEYPRNILMPGGGIQLDARAFQKQFQVQIDKSVELEQRDARNVPGK